VSDSFVLEVVNADIFGMQHFRNTLMYIQTRQRQYAERDGGEEGENGENGEEGKEGGEAGKKVDWEAVDVVGGCLKMGITR
jgi:vacuolar protein sorting-associated protein 35